jgi:hypothetical protein
VCGRQADQVERRAADQGALAGQADRFQILGLELGKDESVDGGAGAYCVTPGFVFDWRRVGLAHRLEGPEGALLGGDHVLGRLRFAGGRRFVPDRAISDPGSQVGDFGVGEFALRRHFEALVCLGDSLQKQAVIGIARNDCGAGFAAFEEGFAAAHFQTAHARARVAGETVFRQKRADAHLEEVALIGDGSRRQGGRQEKRRQRKCQARRGSHDFDFSAWRHCFAVTPGPLTDACAVTGNVALALALIFPRRVRADWLLVCIWGNLRVLRERHYRFIRF